MIRFESGEGHHLDARGSDMWFKARAADTQGRYSFMERTLPPGGRMPPAHRHRENDEAYFVLEGDVTFHTARSTAFPQPAPGTAPAPGPKLLPAGELRKWLGVRQVVYSASPANLAVTDSDLA